MPAGGRRWVPGPCLGGGLVTASMQPSPDSLPALRHHVSERRPASFPGIPPSAKDGTTVETHSAHMRSPDYRPGSQAGLRSAFDKQCMGRGTRGMESPGVGKFCAGLRQRPAPPPRPVEGGPTSSKAYKVFARINIRVLLKVPVHFSRTQQVLTMSTRALFNPQHHPPSIRVNTWRRYCISGGYRGVSMDTNAPLRGRNPSLPFPTLVMWR